MAVTDVHEEKNTFTVDVNLPGHAARGSATPLFERSRKHLLERDGGRCWICNCTAEQTGHPIEAHHYPIERSFAEMIDWGPASQIRKDFPSFGWGTFSIGETWKDVPAWKDEDGTLHPASKEYVPADPYLFVDDMNVNGRLLCKAHHIGKDEGVHGLPEPVWLAQRYGKEGYQFSSIEIIHHDQEPA
ncbi:hypothetical protein GN109_06045 [Collimonas pratensis]|uniref:hypothetical protein n=1 Tax=Collimonas pratensis TaxID=279113 RepID=UPI00143CE412|nr:hypothetical protein [Collimonas pratensis]NKI68975.1 hypothetical protein [Collimonas pratensis]